MKFDKKRLLILGGAVLLLIAAVLFWREYEDTDGWAPLPEETAYQGSEFSFSYPRGYSLQEYARGVVSLGTKTDDTRTSLVEVVRYRHDPDVATPASFQAFVNRQALALCGSDDATFIISCSNPVATSTEFGGEYEGSALTLTMTRTNAAGETTREDFGPIYVFNTTPEVTAEDPLRYEAIFVYPSLEAVRAGTSTPALVEQVARSIVIE